MKSAQNLTVLPVLSVRQPWASYLVSGFKTLELRSWSTPYRGWIWIHTGKKPDLDAMRLLKLDMTEFRCGGLIGLAQLDTCLLLGNESLWLTHRGEHLSPGYYAGPCYGWRFSDALSLPEVIACNGELGLFRLSDQTREYVQALMANDYYRDFAESASDLTRTG